MTPDQYDLFVEPGTDQRLVLRDAVVENGQVRSGILCNPETGMSYPIRDYVPAFVSDDGYAANFGFQWQRHAQVQLDSYTGASYSHDRLYRTTGWPAEGRLDGELILEAGSGAGRFTEVLARTGATIYSFDYSTAAFANFANNGHCRNVAISRGNIYAMPFRAQQFDRVLCLGVLQHTPDVHRSFTCLTRMVRSGGQLIIDVYPRTWRHMLHWKYLLRPFTTRMNPGTLHKVVSWYAPRLMPLAAWCDRIGGPSLRRLVPILDQSNKQVSPACRREWTILDTFDALGAVYDQPQSGRTIRKWFEEAGFKNITICEQEVTAVGTAP